jgi:CMP-N-acetylneuraminic acid synthetase
MTTKKKIVAIVPMRHNSERVKGKNYRDFAGKPLYQRILDTLCDVEMISEIVVDTDSELIMEECRKVYPNVTLLLRPESLRDGAIPMNNVLLNICDQVEADFYLQTHSTNPLLKSETIDNALKQFLNDFPVYDSLFSVTRLQQRLWDPLARAINHNPSILLRTQDLPATYLENSCIYIFTKEILKSRFNRIGNRPMMFEMDEIEAQDIDVELNFKVAEFLFKEQNREL